MVTYLPLPLIGIMIIFGLMGKIFHVGWLEAAPDVLMIPTLLAYYLSLIMGAVYGYIKKEDGVYLMAFIGIIAWIVGMLFSVLTSLSHEIMYFINGIFIAVFLVLHILQFRATKKWEKRLAA